VPLGKLPPPRRCLRGASFSVWFALGFGEVAGNMAEIPANIIEKIYMNIS
jgi:hypothetical protein